MDFKVILLDIEGTTTPITFVTETLFPYVKTYLKSYLDKNWKTDELQQVVNNLRKQYQVDIEAKLENVPKIENNLATDAEIMESIVANVLWQMSLNRKTTALKDLQGRMWEKAYKCKEIEGDLFQDVFPVLKQLHKAEINIYIYSSGSVYAQKLLFGHSVKGDLLPLISGHFDTNIGDKKSKESYIKIVENIGAPADQILFLTDVEQEASAALQANMKVKVVLRPGNKPIEKDILSQYDTIDSFHDLIKS